MTDAILSDPSIFLAASAPVVLGVGSAVLSIFAFFPYARDTFLGKTQPQRACWLIWSVLSGISLLSQIAEGAGTSLWFAGIQSGGTLVIFALSLRQGTGSLLRPGDSFILGGAAFGLVLWAMTDSAIYALLISIGISLLGGAATVRKAYREPESETMITWVVCLLASTMAMGSVGKLDWVLLAYPLYLFTLYASIVTAILLSPARRSGAEQAVAPVFATNRGSLQV